MSIGRFAIDDHSALPESAAAREGRLAGAARVAAFVAVAAALAAGLPAAVSAQDGAEDLRWLPWLGCWQASPASDPLVVAGTDDSPLVCVRPDDDERGVSIAIYADGEPVHERRIVADGERRPVDDSGCAGWEAASWAADGSRVFLRSELDCEGGARRVTSGVIGMLPGSEWIDVQMVGAGEHRGMRALRFRPADEAAMERLGIAPAAADRALAVETGRAAVARRLTVADVVEAVRHTEPEVVEALLLERGDGFRLDAATLVELADAGVPGEVTDLMIALSNPDVFDVDPGVRRGDYRQADDLPVRTGVIPVGVPVVGVHRPYRGCGYGRGYGSGYGYGLGYGSRDPYRYPYRYNPWGFSTRGYDCRGAWGRGPYIWRPVTSRPIIVVRGEDSGGRVVKDRGYTRTRGGSEAGPRAVPRTGRSPFGVRVSGSGTPSRGSEGARSGGSSSGKSTDRKAKPRTGGSQ